MKCHLITALAFFTLLNSAYATDFAQAAPQKEIKLGSTAEDIVDIAPEFVKLTKETLFADIWKRPGLSLRDKSLVTITTLAALNRTEQIEFHLGYGLDNGLTEKEIVSAMTQVAFYAGWPSAMSGLTHFKKVLEERKAKKK